MKKRVSLILMLALLILLYSCPNGSGSSDKDELPNAPGEGEPKIIFEGNNIHYFWKYSTYNEFAYELIKELYLWRDELPELKYDVNQYLHPHYIYEELRYEKDEWSFATEWVRYAAMLEGNSTGLGLSFDVLEVGSNNYEIRISTLQEDSDFYKQGVRRGDEIISIDNYTPTQLYHDENMVYNIQYVNNSANFVINRNNGGEITLNIERRVINSKIVDKKAILNCNNRSTGYLSFNFFNDHQQNEIDEAFEYFNNHDIKELIIDLRYNGGGATSVSDHIVDILIGNKHEGKVISNFYYNDLYSHFNSTNYIKNAGYDFNFDKIYFLTNDDTASSSELLINSLDPYIEVLVIGENSYGKPVGMIILPDPDYKFAYAPISLKSDNSEGVTDYFDGIPVDKAINDPVSFDYGDENDPLISAAIYHINNGTFQTGSRSLNNIKKTDTFKLEGFNRLRGFF